MMFAHALMNAAGHALFAGERVAAENLAHRAMREFELLTAESGETQESSTSQIQALKRIPVYITDDRTAKTRELARQRFMSTWLVCPHAVSGKMTTNRYLSLERVLCYWFAAQTDPGARTEINSSA